MGSGGGGGVSLIARPWTAPVPTVPSVLAAVRSASAATASRAQPPPPPAAPPIVCPLAAGTKRQCTCHARIPPHLTLRQLDDFVAARTGALICAFAVTPGSGLAVTATSEYARLHSTRRRPCLEGQADSHVVVTLDAAAPELLQRHRLSGDTLLV